MNNKHNDTFKRLAVGKREAGAMIGLSVRSVENYIALKKIETRKLGRRTVVLVSSLEKFLRQDQPSASPTQRQEGSG
jgi:hypothetical protein